MSVQLDQSSPYQRQESGHKTAIVCAVMSAIAIPLVFLFMTYLEQSQSFDGPLDYIAWVVSEGEVLACFVILALCGVAFGGVAGFLIELSTDTYYIKEAALVKPRRPSNTTPTKDLPVHIDYKVN
jgi:hypothetical protein